MSNFRITGLNELRVNLRKLSKAVPKELKKSMRKVTKPIQRGMKAEAPRDSGALRKSIATKIGIGKKTGAVFAIVGVRSRFATNASGRVAKKGESWVKLPNLYASVIEYGASAFKSRKTSHIANRFREKTFNRTKNATIIAVAREVKLLMDRGRLF